MFNKAVKNVAVLLLGSFMMLGNASAQDVKFAYINLQSVVQQLPQMAAIEENINAEFKERIEVLEKLQADAKFQREKLKREGATMSTAQQQELETKIVEMENELRTKGGPLRQQMQARFAQERNKILAMVQQAVEQVAKSENVDVVLRADNIAYANPAKKLDISKQVADKVKTQK